MQNKISAMIKGCGSYLPSQIISSRELMHEAKIKEHTSELFFERATGIKNRRFFEDETYERIASIASLKAIEQSGIDPLDIDIVIYCGIEGDLPEPSTAISVMHNIGTTNAHGYDISNACIGMFNGIEIAQAYICSGMYENILLCTAEIQSKLTYAALRQLGKENNRKSFKRLMGAFTVGDAGGAFIVSKAEPGKGFTYTKFSSDPSQKDLCFYKINANNLEFAMEMETLSKLMGSEHGKMISQTYSKLRMQPEEISNCFCHQVGAKAHQSVASITKLGLQKVPKTYDDYANLTSATPAVLMSIFPPTENSTSLMLGAGSGWTICQMVHAH